MSLDGPVVVALDGSPHSAQTLRWGIEEAALHGAPVVLVRACPDTLDINRLGWYPLVEDTMFEVDAREYLAETLTHVRERWPHVSTSTRLLHGPEVPALREVSASAALLVVGASGRSGRRRLGSTGAHVATHAHCPVVVVRSPEITTAPLARVVVGVDGSPPSIDAARVAAQEAALRGTGLVVVHARGQGVGTRADAGDGADPVEELATVLRGDPRGLDVTVEVRDDDAPAALLEAARGARLLVVGSRGLGAFRGMLMGSVSAEVLRLAHLPVLVVRAGTSSGRHGEHDEG